MVYTRLSVMLTSQRSYAIIYLQAKVNTTYYYCLIRVIMIALIMRIVLNQS